MKKLRKILFFYRKRSASTTSHLLQEIGGAFLLEDSGKILTE